MFSDFHFLRPLWLLLLIFPLIGYRYFFASRRNISAWEAVCDKNLLKFLLIKGNSRQRSFIGYSAIIGIIFAIIALSGPSWQKKEAPVLTPINPVMILLNMSSDMDSNDLQPNRLSRAKFTIDDLLKEIQAQVGLIVYTNEPFIISPITEDKNIISNLLPAITDDIMPENGDRLYRAIDMAITKLKEEGYPFGNIIVIAPDVGQDFEKALSSASAAAQSGYKVNTVAARADKSEKLALLSSKGDGVYTDVKNISALVSTINSQISSSLEQSKNKQETWIDNGYWFVFVPLVCFLVFFRRGVFIFLLITMFSFSAHAGFFTNQNQDGIKFFEQGNYAKAAKSFEHPQWKASALYKQQKYNEALKLFEKDDSIEGIYNQGNSLAKLGKIEEAIQKYEQVLEQNPNHEDAKFNLEYLKQQQEQQQNQQSNSEDKNDNNQSSENNNEQQKDESDQNSEGHDNENNQENQDNEQNNNDDSSSQNEQDSLSENNQDEQNQQDRQNPQDSTGEKNDDAGENMPQSLPSDSSQNEKSDKENSAQAQKQEEDVKGDFDEETQAREMTYRNIPEDAGGLLRAFIFKEYNKNRYGDK